MDFKTFEKKFKNQDGAMVIIDAKHGVSVRANRYFKIKFRRVGLYFNDTYVATVPLKQITEVY
jgi:hypothetical protein